jgi:hypothetical protein
MTCQDHNRINPTTKSNGEREELAITCVADLNSHNIRNQQTGYDNIIVMKTTSPLNITGKTFSRGSSWPFATG